MLRPSADAGPPVRIVIADDHPIFRDGLRKLLETEPDFAVVGEAGDGEGAVAAVETFDPDVLLLDVAMPRLGGLEVLPMLQGRRTRVLLLTAAISDARLVQALQLGARGVILKASTSRLLFEGIRRVVSGKYVVAEGAVETLAEAVRRPAVDRERRFNLTARELEIIAGILAGHTNKQIAERLSISVQTVKHHLTSIFDKTSVSSRLELAMFAVRQKLTTGG